MTRWRNFVESGGVLLRFAGTRLAAGEDDLTPVALRRGGRTLGGALSWETPKHIAPFDKDSPFFGLAAPDEVTVSRQVLAEPEPGLADKTWARLADGTPLVTAAPRGKGLIVLFHVTADTTWSNLPLSGLFVDMLRRVVARAGAGAGRDGDARARRTNRRRARPIARSTASARSASRRPTPRRSAAISPAPATPTHPPGFYGPPDALEAVNALAPGATLDAGRLRRPRRRRRRARGRRAARSDAVAAARRLHRLPRRRARQPVARPRAALRAAGRGGVAPHRRARRRDAPCAGRARRRRADLRPRRRRGARHPSCLCRKRRRRRSTRPPASASRTSARVLGERTSAQIAAPIAVDPAHDELELLSADLLADRRRPAAACRRRRSPASPPL